MNAIQFIQKHGVKRAKECLPSYEKNYCGLEQLFTEELKRLVESVDIIKELGGIHRVKRTYKSRPFELAYSDLKQAIADYESIYGGEHV